MNLGSFITDVISENNKREKNIIIKDDIAYCTRCGVAKQRYITINGNDVKVWKKCECELSEYRKLEKQLAIQAHQLKVDKIKEKGLREDKLKKFTFDNDDGRNEAGSRIAKKFCENWEDAKKRNIGLHFYGDTGNGKTFFAGCIANYLVEKEVKVAFTSIIRIEEQIKSGNPDILLELSKDYDLLILDDVGTERDTPYMIEKTYEIINSRYLADKPIIVTSNFTKSEFSNTDINMKYKRIFERLKEMTIPVHLQGERRAEIRQKKMSDFRKLMGC